MIHKQENLQFDKGTILFHFDIETDFVEVKITNIVAFSNFDSGIPEYPYLENMGDGWKIYAYNTTMENGKPVPTYQAITTFYAKKMANVLMAAQEKENAALIN